MRAALAQWPTPLQCSGGAPGLFVKREDLCGFGFGGAKTRLLPSMLERASAEKSSAIVTGGRWNSNWVPLAVLAAVRAGMDAHVVFDCGPAGRGPSLAPQLARSLGAQVHSVGEAGASDVQSAIDSIARSLVESGERPYAVPRAGRDPVAARAYSRIIDEVAEQVDWPNEVVFHVPVGSGGLACGLALGLAVGRFPGRVIGVSVTTSAAKAWSKIVRMSDDLAAEAGVTAGDLIARITVVESPSTPDGRGSWPRAMRRVVDDLGLMLDPVFTEPTWKAAFAAGNPAHGSSFAVLMASGGVPAFYDHLEVFDR